MRILILNHEFPPCGGGAATASGHLAREFVAAGHEVCVVTMGLGWSSSSDSSSENLSIHRLGCGRRRPEAASFSSWFAYLIRASFKALNLHRRCRYEHIVAFFSMPAGLVAWTLHQLAHTPYVISLRGGDVPGFVPSYDRTHKLLSPLRRRILADAQRCIANDPALAEMSRKADPFPVEVITNGVDTARFRPATLRFTAPLRLINVGRFYWQKNIEFLLTLVAALKETQIPVSLDLVGDGPDRRKIVDMANSLRITGNIHWHGWLPHTKVASLLEASDVFLHPSHVEGMPNAVLEAMATGLPILASDIPSHRTLLFEMAPHCLLPTETALWVSQIRQWLKSPPSARELGQRLRSHAVATYSWSRVAAEYLQVIDS